MFQFNQLIICNQLKHFICKVDNLQVFPALCNFYFILKKEKGVVSGFICKIVMEKGGGQAERSLKFFKF